MAEDKWLLCAESKDILNHQWYLICRRRETLIHYSACCSDYIFMKILICIRSRPGMRLEDVRKACLNCTKCDLCKTRTNVVFGTGRDDADIMFVGEGPGQEEDLQGKPFVGRSGQLLSSYLGAVGINRDEVFITNIVKCRPPGNRDPKPEEQELCIDYLKSQVRVIKPAVIVCLGRIAACRLIDEDFKVTKQHGEIIHKKGYTMIGTYHPSALLRNPTLKFAALKDFQIIAAEAKNNRD